MGVSSLLKSPYALGGAGFAGSGGLGVGGWQIYEAADPSVDRDLTGRGFVYSPTKQSAESETTHAKFNWQNWGCVDRLFPGLEVKHETYSSPTKGTSAAQEETTLQEINGNFITCGMMQMQRVTLDSKYQNRIYFKSEVAVKGDNWGWISWTGLSTLPQKKNDASNQYEGSINFLHNLILLTKEQGTWKIKKGYGWFDYYEQNLSTSKFVITIPKEEWFSPAKPRGYTDSDEGFPKYREWAGIAEVSNSADAKTLLSTMSIYRNSPEYAEFWGNGGQFKESSAGLSGYHSSNMEYSADKGWQSIGQRDISDDLKNWYKPFLDKKVVWSELDARCSEFSRKRNRKVSSGDDDLKALCYSKPTTKAK